MYDIEIKLKLELVSALKGKGRSEIDFALQNLLPLWWKMSEAGLSPLVDSSAFDAQYSWLTFLAYLSQTALNWAFDKDYVQSACDESKDNFHLEIQLPPFLITTRKTSSGGFKTNWSWFSIQKFSNVTYEICNWQAYFISRLFKALAYEPDDENSITTPL